MSIMKINSGIEIDTKNNFLLAEVIDTNTNNIYLISRTELEAAKEVGDSKVIEMLNEYDALDNIDNIVNYVKNNNIGNFTLDLEGNNLTVDQYCSAYRTIKQIDDSSKYIPQKSMIGSHLTTDTFNADNEMVKVNTSSTITTTDFNEGTKEIDNINSDVTMDINKEIENPINTYPSQYSTTTVNPITMVNGDNDLDIIANRIFSSTKKEDSFYLTLLKQYSIETVIDNIFQLITKNTIIDKSKVEKFQTVLIEDTQYSELDVRKLAGKVYSLFAKHLLDLTIIETDKENKLALQIESRTTPIVEAVVEDFEHKIEVKTKEIIEKLKLKYNINSDVEEVLYSNIIKKIGGK